MRCRRPIVLSSLVVVAAFGLLAAGCGGGGGSPGIASVADSTTTASTTTQSSSPSGGANSSGPSGGGRSQFQIAMRVGNTEAGAKFSACMRKHGVTNFPDPSSQGVIKFGSASGIDPNSPTFKSARTVCQKLLPNGGQPTPAQIAQQQQQLLAFAKCMRSHGIKDFPDPTNGGLQIKDHPGSDLDPNNSQFQKAQQACQGDLPFKDAPATAKAGGG